MANTSTPPTEWPQCVAEIRRRRDGESYPHSLFASYPLRWNVLSVPLNPLHSSASPPHLPSPSPSSAPALALAPASPAPAPVPVPVPASALSLFPSHTTLPSLVSPSPPLSSLSCTNVVWLYLNSFGGGVVSGDKVEIDIQVKDGARVVLLSQSVTKIFKCLNQR